MDKKQLFEATLAEPEEESGQTIRNHIIGILEPFKETAQIEWAIDQIWNACESQLDKF